MVLPLYLALTGAEMSSADALPQKMAWMACHFSPCGEGLSNLPTALPAGAMLILNDRMPCQGHSPGLVASQIAEAVEKLGCESVLLDFQRPADIESAAMVRSVLDALPCPGAVSESHAEGLSCPVFLAPAPLHVPLAKHLRGWRDREIWLEAALCQECVTVTAQGAVFTPQFPTDKLEGGFYDDSLRCNYRMKISEAEVRFTLFDTRESLEKKLDLARSLGVTRAVGLYQELKASP